MMKYTIENGTRHTQRVITLKRYPIPRQKQEINSLTTAKRF